ncbi:MAG TPA: LLM class flavin-dependent oxidoreductase, partial [Thermomicrobiales bacterium]|nr:LLM class flavin-dependent oxidoreductase [Thermomicrobiales bacterium]
MTGLRFGVMNFCRSPYRELSQRVSEAEAMGFDSAWVDDDVLTPSYVDYEAWTVLGALAAETERIRLGTMVTVPPFRHPAVLAAQVITVDHISQGRAQIGLGAGGPSNNYRAVGFENWSPRERAERLEEQAAILSALLRGERLDFEGQHYLVADAQVTQSIQRPRPPLIVAAHGERGLRTVARYADGWNTMGGQAYPAAQDPRARIPLAEAVASTKRLSDRLDAICEEEGRDPSSIRRTVLVYRTIDDPLSSIDAFDEYVGAYRKIGTDEIIFYWPPLDNLFPKTGGSSGFSASEPLSAAQRSAFERVVA